MSLSYLLDTCTFLWLAIDAPALSSRAREIAGAKENVLFFSSVSAWEIGLKYSHRRLALPKTPSEYVPSLRRRMEIEELPLDEAAALLSSDLPLIHGDPFDRMLVCQALAYDLTIITPDSKIREYMVKTVW